MPADSGQEKPAWFHTFHLIGGAVRNSRQLSTDDPSRTGCQAAKWREFNTERPDELHAVLRCVREIPRVREQRRQVLVRVAEATLEDMMSYPFVGNAHAHLRRGRTAL